MTNLKPFQQAYLLALACVLLTQLTLLVPQTQLLLIVLIPCAFGCTATGFIGQFGSPRLRALVQAHF